MRTGGLRHGVCGYERAIALALQNEHLIIRTGDDNKIAFLVGIEIAGSEHITGDPRLNRCPERAVPNAEHHHNRSGRG